jgi:TetR/AcrR family transcriptional repressor of mexJK operon
MREAARELWLEHGYQTSMDAVAKRAGCSKQTVYAHFGSKEGLFRGVVTDLVAPLIANLEVKPGAMLEKTLLEFAIQHAERMAQPETIARRRILYSEASRYPEESRAVLQVGLNAIQARLAQLVGDAMQRGELRKDDPDVAAEMFIGMSFGVETERQFLGLPVRTTRAARERWARLVVGHFMKIYSPSAL